MSSYPLSKPLGLAPDWHHDIHDTISPGLYQWLTDSGSLTARLKRHCHHFRVEVLWQGMARPQPCERQRLDLADDEPVWTREVLLYCDDQPHVFAHSIAPPETLSGPRQALRQLDDRPLGQLLFNDPCARQTGFEKGCLRPPAPLFDFLASRGIVARQPLWGRRSLFQLEGRPLLVAELFLPAALAYREDD